MSGNGVYQDLANGSESPPNPDLRCRTSRTIYSYVHSWIILGVKFRRDRSLAIFGESSHETRTGDNRIVFDTGSAWVKLRRWRHHFAYGAPQRQLHPWQRWCWSFRETLRSR
jgi:hypothetical protein